MHRILIVDDETIERDYLKSIFENYPHKFFVVGEANNGVQAINMALEKEPDIIIMDINMPGCDGLSASEKIKEHLNTIILLNTAYTEFEYARQAVNLNLDSYLLKPASEEDILKVIEACISKVNNQNHSINYNGLLSVKDKKYPFSTIEKMVSSISNRDPNTLKYCMISYLQFLEARYKELFEYKIYIINSVFSLMMAIKETFPQGIYSLLDCESYLQKVANPIHQKDIIDTVEELLKKATIILESDVIIKSNCSNMVQKYIDDNFDQNITLDLLSEIFHYSPTYISRIFHSEKGITINSYINKLRIDHAVKLLLNTDLAVKEIALSSGFINITHFNRIFKKYTGKTPTDIKNRR